MLLNHANRPILQMNKEPSLEERLSEDNSQSVANPGLRGKIAYHSKCFVVDGSGYALYYAPFMAAAEYLCGVKPEEMCTTRAIGAVTSFLTGYAYNLLRQRSAKKIGADIQEGPSLKKKAVDASLGAITMMPTYAPILYLAGASSKVMVITLLIGSAVGGIVGLGYGYVSDKWRTYCGLKPILNK